MDKLEFIKDAINDTQSTIRAIDAKAGVLLTFLLLPIGVLGKVLYHYVNVYDTYNQMWRIALFLSPVIWALAIFSLVNAITAIDNPIKHIKKEDESNKSKPTGVFFSGGLFDLNFWDIFFNRGEHSVTSNRTISEQLALYPKDDSSEMQLELSCEHLKLVYIREMKFKRFNAALNLTKILFIIGSAIYIRSKFSF